MSDTDATVQLQRELWLQYIQENRAILGEVSVVLWTDKFDLQHSVGYAVELGATVELGHCSIREGK